MTETTPIDFKFQLVLDGVVQARFTECSELSLVSDCGNSSPRGASTDLSPTKNLNNRDADNQTRTITLKRGQTNSRQFVEWCRNAANGKVDRKDGGVLLLDDSGKAILRWSIKSAWPVKLEGPSLNSTNNEVAIESVEIEHEGIDLEE